MITKEQFASYQACRDSGICNMFDLRTVTSVTGLTKAECLEIMKNYERLETTYKETPK